MKGFLDKLKGLFKRKGQADEEENFDEDTGEVDLSKIPDHLRRQLESSGVLDEDEDEDENEDEVPPFIAQEMRPELAAADRTQEMHRPTQEELDATSPLSEDEKEERLRAIRENAAEEDDFAEHSGINHFEEFKVLKSRKDRFAKLKIWAKDLVRSGKSAYAKRSSGAGSGKNSFDLQRSVGQLFHPTERPKLHGLFLILLTLLGTYSLGKILAMSLNRSPSIPIVRWTPPSTPTDGTNLSRELPTVARVDLFNANRREERPTEPRETRPRIDETLICIAADQPSRLPIRLVNTVVLHDSVKSIASVQVRGGRDIMSIREGQKIDNMAEVGRIDRMQLVVKNLSTGQCEFVRPEEERGRRGQQQRPINVVSEREGRELMRRQVPGIQNEGNNFRIEKGLRDQMLSNISEVLTQARAVQITNPDGSLHFKMTEIVPGSIYSQLNIQDGDIIEGINGNPITNLNEVMTMFGRIREIDNLSLSIRRNGVTQSFDYSFD
jgi:type II secretory pathway component PulC